MTASGGIIEATQVLALDASLAVVCIEGPDAQAFLQGQLSSDVAAVRTDRAQLTSCNSPKGRMLLCGLLLRTSAGFALVLPREIAEFALRRLQMFVLRSKVSLRIADCRVFGIQGSGALARLQGLGLPAPATAMDAAPLDGGAALLLRGLGQSRFLLVAFAQGLAAVSALDAVAKGDAEADLAWRAADIRAGMPRIALATQDRFVPQMANLDLLGGVSFEKGCYTGQEIVARLHYLGQLKRRMYLCHGAGETPAAGSDVHAQGHDQAVGEIVDAVPAGLGRFVASVVLQIRHRDAPKLRAAAAELGAPTPYPYMPVD